MGLFENMTEMLGGIVTRKVDSSLYNWIREVSRVLDSDEGGGSFTTRYVEKTGDDTTGDGSFGNPFLTVQRAITSITDASVNKVYRIQVGDGVFTEAFLLQPWMFIVGYSRMNTVLAPVQANFIGTGFSAAGTLQAGILGVRLASTFTVDFSAVASPAGGQFFLLDSTLDGIALNFIGNNTSNVVFCQNLEQINSTAALTHLFRNIASNLAHLFLRSNNLTVDNTGAFAGTVISRLGAIYENQAGATGLITVSGPVGAVTSVNSVILSSFGLQGADRLVITGDGVAVTGPAYFQVAGPDANTTFDYLGAVVSATKLVNAGLNFIDANPTAPRTYTFGSAAPSPGTQIKVKNRSANVITLVFTGGTNTGNISYIDAFGFLDLIFSDANWQVQNPVQAFAVTLTNGVSAAIAADISATSRITATLQTFNGAAGVPIAKPADRVNGTRAGGGSFKITSVTQAAGATVATDQGTYEVIIRF